MIGCDGEAAILLTEGTNHQFMLLSENEEEFISSIDDRAIMFKSHEGNEPLKIPGNSSSK